MTDETPKKPKRAPKGEGAKKTGRKRAGKKSVINRSKSTSAPRNTLSRAPASRGNKEPARPEPIFQEDPEAHATKALIIEAVAEHSLSYVGAAKMIGVNRTTLWRWTKADPNFEAALRQAYVDGTELLKDEAVRRGKGSSDFLLFRTVAARDPSWQSPKFAPPMNNGPVSPGSVNIDLGDATAEELAVLEKLALRRALKSQSQQQGSHLQ